MTSSAQGRAQFAAAVALLAFGLFMFWQASLLKVGTPTSPGPGLFPLGLGALLSALAVGLVAEARGAVGAAVAGAGRVTGGYRLIALVLVLLLALALTLEPLGFLPSTALMTCVLLRLAGRGWVATLVVGLTATVASYWLFGYALGVPLPRGLLDGLL